MGISRYNYCKTHRIYICMVYLPIFTSKSSRNVGKYNSWILWGIHDCLNDFRFGFLIELYLVQYCTTLEPWSKKNKQTVFLDNNIWRFGGWFWVVNGVRWFRFQLLRCSNNFMPNPFDSITCTHNDLFKEMQNSMTLPETNIVPENGDFQ